MKPCTNIQQLRTHFLKIKTGWSGDTIFGATALMFLCELAVAKNGKRRIQPTRWQSFFGAGMKAGKTPAVIASQWRALREIESLRRTK